MPTRYAPGQPLVATQRFGHARTDIAAFQSTADLVVMSVDGAGTWSGPIAITSQEFGVASGMVAASQQYGELPAQTDLFVVDNSGTLMVFWSSGPGAGWKGQAISGKSVAKPGGGVAVAPQYGLTSGVANQTDVFVVDSTGTLTVYWVVGGSSWSQGLKISDAGLFPEGAPITAGCRPIPGQIGLQTDVFVVDKNGALHVFWVSGAGIWQTKKISAEGAFPASANLVASRQAGAGSNHFGNQLDVFLVDNEGFVNVFYAYGNSEWLSEKISGTGFAQPGAPLAVSQHFPMSANQTDVFVVDSTGALNVFSVVGAGKWSGRRVGTSGEAPANCHLTATCQFGAPTTSNQIQTDVAFVASDGSLIVYYALDQSKWNRFVMPDLGLQPLAGAGSGRNFILVNNCSNLPAVKVEIDITEDLVPQKSNTASGGGIGGIGLQLNCNSALNQSTGWQQYFVRMSPQNDILGQPADTPALRHGINNWWPSGNFKIYEGTIFYSLPSGFRIPAGYKIVIELYQAPGGSAIAGATFSINNGSSVVAQQTVAIVGLERYADTPGETSDGTAAAQDEAPLVGVQLDIVAWANGEQTTFLEGAGTITYSSVDKTPLSPAIANMACLTAENLVVTAEGSNINYAVLPASPSATITQFFQAVTPSLATESLITDKKLATNIENLQVRKLRADADGPLP